MHQINIHFIEAHSTRTTVNKVLKTVQSKGRELETVVRQIEELILSSDPALKHSDLIFESNKILSIQGVRHEIDLFVQAKHPKGYDLTFIFECKNWKKPVGKNEIISFSEKLKVSAAQRGFFVAPKFTSDARAQAAQDPRMELVTVNREFTSMIDNLNFKSVSHEFNSMNVRIKERGHPPLEHPEILNLNQLICAHEGQPVKFTTFAVKLADQWILEDRSANSSRYQLEGSHNRFVAYEVVFSNKNEFLINDMDIEYITLEVNYTIHVHISKVKTKYEIEKRGRVFIFSPIVSSPDHAITIEAVQLI